MTSSISTGTWRAGSPVTPACSVPWPAVIRRLPEARRATAGSKRLPQVAQPVLGLFPVGGEALRLPDLELVALADEGHPVADPRMVADRLGQDHASLPIAFEDLALADQRRRQILVILRERLEIGEARPDRVAKMVAARVDRLTVEGRAAVDPVEPVHRQHRPERRGNRNPPLGVEPICEGGNEFVHAPRLPRRAAPSAARSLPRAGWSPEAARSTDETRTPARRLRNAMVATRPTLSWDSMGYHGTDWEATDSSPSAASLKEYSSTVSLKDH